MRSYARTLALVALLGGTASSLLAAPSSSAVVPRDGFGFGVADPDAPLDDNFAKLRARTFRFIVPWNAADDPAQRAYARQRIAGARAAGVQEIVVTFERPAAPVSRTTWLNAVQRFVNEFSPDVEWWSPANEPNFASSLPKVDPVVLARYTWDFAWWLALAHPTDRLLSPEFTDGGELESYIQAFRNGDGAARGQFGHAIAWHPYRGVRNRDITSTEALVRAAPTNLPIWVTEVGAHGPNDSRRPQTEEAQNDQVRWIVLSLATHPRIARISYYHLRAGNPRWDTALTAIDGRRRLAWYTWCYASHGWNGNARDCDPPWSNWESLGGQIKAGTGPAASSRESSKLDVFVNGINGGVHQRTHNPGVGWGDWVFHGGQLLGDPASASWDQNRVDLFVRGLDSALYQKVWQANIGWSDWIRFPSTLTSSPAASSWGSGRLDVFANGGSNQLLQMFYDAWNWSSWMDLGGTLNSDPAAVSWSQDRLDVFAKGALNRIYQRFWQRGVGWSEWIDLGGSFTSAPSVASWGPNRLDLFARGPQNQLMHRIFDGTGWSEWIDLGGTLASAPEAVSWGPNRIDVFARGPNGDLVHRWMTR